MSKNKFTRGPWNIKCYSIVVGNYPDNDVVGVIETYGKSDEEALSNAILLYAAPELLEALENIIKACDSCEKDDDVSIVDAFTEDMEIAARQAIAKAKGTKND